MLDRRTRPSCCLPDRLRPRRCPGPPRPWPPLGPTLYASFLVLLSLAFPRRGMLSRQCSLAHDGLLLCRVVHLEGHAPGRSPILGGSTSVRRLAGRCSTFGPEAVSQPHPSEYEHNK